MNCRNGAEYIQEAVDSLLAQTYADWELVAWDDGSTDETCAILRSFRDSRFRVVSSAKSESLGQSRRMAIEACRGEWVAFLDQDDIWAPTKLARQVEVADWHPECAIIYGRTLRFGEAVQLKEYDHRHEWSALPEGEIFEQLFKDSCFICMSSSMLRASAIAQVPQIPDEIRLTPDYYLYLTLARTFTAYAVQEPVCFYRWHSGNLTKLKGQQVQWECLGLLDQFAPQLPTGVVRRRRRIHHSLIAFSMMCSARTLGSGASHLLRHGSLTYLLSRPFARAYRAAKRELVRPYWKLAPGRADATQLSSGVPTCYENDRRKLSGTLFPRSHNLLGTSVSVSTFDEAREFLGGMVEERIAGYVCNANVYSVMLARENSRLRRNLAAASYVNADGMPIVWMLRAFGFSSAERVHGDNLFLSCCGHFPQWRHFLVGGREGQVEHVAGELRKRYPGMQIVGGQATPKRPLPENETARILDEIKASHANIVWVGMGTPAQDAWMSYAAPQAGIPMVGVGSSFDMLSGRSQPTPEWMQRSGLQWLFRLAQEPRRLFKRYTYYNTCFLIAAAAALATTSRTKPLTRENSTDSRVSG